MIIIKSFSVLQQAALSQLFLALIICSRHSSDGAETPVSVKFLVLLPLSTEEFPAGTKDWDRGREILPGAVIATEEINNNSDILQDCRLELVAVNIDFCNEELFASNLNALIPFTDILSDNFRYVLGVIGGPFCQPLLTRLISPLANRREVSLFQVSGSTSAIARGKKGLSNNLNFVSPSTEIYYKAVYAMMREFRWTRIFILAEEFFQGLTTLPGHEGLDITYRQFTRGLSHEALFSELRRSEKKIVFVSIGPIEAAEVLCEAHTQSLIHPHYVWIFHDLMPELIINSSTSTCGHQELSRALEGAFFLNFPLRQPADHTKLVSGRTYSEYYSEYVSRLATTDDDVSDIGGEQKRRQLKANLFANVLYDAVYAFALALDRAIGQDSSAEEDEETQPVPPPGSNNSSLGEASSSLHNETTFEPDFLHLLSLSNKEELIDQMQLEFPNISFEGASGHVNLNNADINGFVVLSRQYNSTTTQNVGNYHQGGIIIHNSTLTTHPPSGVLDSRYELIPLPLVAFLTGLTLVALLLTTAILFIFIHFRNFSDIKATSPYLSYLMFLGCYLLLGSTLVHVVTGGFAMPTTGVVTVTVCGAVITGNSLGVNLIFTTLMLRMLRVYRVFSSFGKTGKFWSDKIMILIVLLVVLGDIVLIVVWSLIDTFHIIEVIHFQPWESPPYYEISQFCHSDHLSIWLGILLGKLGALFLVVIYLAIKTRKIRRSNFKDTKKVNVYVFTTVMVVSTFMSLYFLFKSTNNIIGTYMMVFLAFGITEVSCQAFLFVPKVTSALLHKYGYEVSYDSKKRRSTIQKSVDSRKKSLIQMLSTAHFTELL